MLDLGAFLSQHGCTLEIWGTATHFSNAVVDHADQAALNRQLEQWDGRGELEDGVFRYTLPTCRGAVFATPEALRASIAEAAGAKRFATVVTEGHGAGEIADVCLRSRQRVVLTVGDSS